MLSQITQQTKPTKRKNKTSTRKLRYSKSRTDKKTRWILHISNLLYRQRANKTRKNKQAHSNRLWNKTPVNTIKRYKDKLLYRRNKKTKETTEETVKTEKRKQKLSKDKREDTKGISKDIQQKERYTKQNNLAIKEV